LEADNLVIDENIMIEAKRPNKHGEGNGIEVFIIHHSYLLPFKHTGGQHIPIGHAGSGGFFPPVTLFGKTQNVMAGLGNTLLVFSFSIYLMYGILCSMC
jgi:hypothetical protein